MIDHLTDEAVKALAHKYRFAKDDHERAIAQTAEALLEARADNARLRADAKAAVALVVEQAASLPCAIIPYSPENKAALDAAAIRKGETT